MWTEDAFATVAGQVLTVVHTRVYVTINVMVARDLVIWNVFNVPFMLFVASMGHVSAMKAIVDSAAITIQVFVILVVAQVAPVQATATVWRAPLKLTRIIKENECVGMTGSFTKIVLYGQETAHLHVNLV